MMKEQDVRLIKSFFGGHFHQDWHCDHATPRDVVESYLKEVSDVEACALANAILEYSGTCETDAQLERNLFSQLGCYYVPSALGSTAADWLKEISSQLIAGCKH